MISHAFTLIGFRRPRHIQDTLKALANNYGATDVPLYVFIDGPRGDKEANAQEHAQVEEVRRVCKNFPWKGKKVMHAASSNKGLLRNVRYAIDTTLSDYEAAVIVEDDIVTSPYFYEFVAQALQRFKDAQEVAAICGHCYPYARKLFNPHAPYFLRHFACWGWATWRRSWDGVCWDTAQLVKTLAHTKRKKELDFGNARWVSGILDAQHSGFLNTWDVQTGVSFFLNDQLCLYPPETLTNNTGWRADGLSTHLPTTTNPNAALAYKSFEVPQDVQIIESVLARRAYTRFVCPPKTRIKNYGVNALIQAKRLLKPFVAPLLWRKNT